MKLRFVLDFVSRMRSQPHIILVAVAAIALVCVWHECASLTKPAHFDQKAIELGSVAPLRQTLSPSSSGNRLLFERNTDIGLGIFLWQGSSNAKLLYEHDDSTLNMPEFGILGWSTDDGLFAYASQVTRYSAHIIVANGESGTTVEKIPADGSIMGFTWLSPTKFVYMNNKRQLHMFEKVDGGKWIESASFGNVADVPPNVGDRLAAGRTRELYAISDHKIAWLERGTIWTFDLTWKSTEILWSTNSNIISASFCPKTKEFLLELGDDNTQALYTYALLTDSLTDLGKHGDKDHPICFPNWANDGKGYGFLVKEYGNYSLYLYKNATAGDSTEVFSKAGAWRYATTRDSIFVIGSLTNEPPGIWEYDIANGSTYCIVPAQQEPFEYAKSISPEWGTLTNDVGHTINFCVWVPVTAPQGKKHPIILCQTPYNWSPYAEIAANEGFYFVGIDRARWIDKGLSDWGRDVKCVYEHLSKTLNINTNSVFCFGASAETGPMSEFLSNNPHFCKGVLLYHPSRLPDISGTGISTMLIVDGSKDPDEVKRVSTYQDEALKLGVPVTLVILNTPHSAWRVAIQRQNVQILARYLSGVSY